MAQLKDKKQSANKAKNVKKTNLTTKATDKNKKAVTANKESVPAVVNLGGKAKEVSKKGLSDLNYSDYYKDYLANKKDHKPDTKKIASLFKKASKPKNLGFSKIQQPKVFNETTPISYTKEVANDGYGKYFSKPGNQTVKAIPTVAVNLPAPINQTQQFAEPSFQQQYPNAYQNPNNFIQSAALPVKNNQFNNPRNNFYPNPESGFINYNNQNFNQFHPGFSRNQNPRFNPNYQGFNNYPSNYFPKPINPFNQNPIDNVSTEQLLNFNLLDNGVPAANNANNNPNAIALANQRPDAVVLNQVTTLLDIMQRQMMTQQIILEKQQNQIERQQDIIERLQTKLIESQNQISTEQNFDYSDSAEIEPTDFLETQEHQFNNLNQNYYQLDKTRKIAKNDRYDHFVDLSATKKIEDKKNKAQDTVHVTDTLEYETDEIGSGEIVESDLIEYTDFDDSEDLIDPNLSQDDFQAKNLNNQEEFVKTTADGQIDLDEKNLTKEQEDDAEEDDEYTDLVSEEIDTTLYKKADDSDLDNEELIKTSELEEFDEDHDDYTDLVTEEHLSTSDLSESSKVKTKSDLIATSIIENLEEDHNNLTKSKKKDLNLSETKLSPTKRFWEPLVGNPQYGFYNKKSWNWIGYFDRLKKWIPYSDSNQAPENPTFHNSLITKKVGKFNFWQKLVDNLDYGHRENGSWIWDGVFDQNFNWIPDPTIVKDSALTPSDIEKVDLSVDNDLYAKYIGNEYYGYYDDDHKWVWTGNFSTDGTFIPDKIDLVASTTQLADEQSDKTDAKKSFDQEPKEDQDSLEVRKERKRLRQERRRLEKLQAKITSELIEKKNDFEDKDDFEKIPGETIEEIRGVPVSDDVNVVLPDEPAVINTKKSKKSEPHFWEEFLGNSAYGHYNSDHQWVWDGYFDDDRNWVADGISVAKKVQPDQEQVLPEIKKEQKEVLVATQETKNLQVDVKIQDQDVSKVLSKTYKEQPISLPEKTEGVVLDQKIEIIDSKQPVESKQIEQTKASDKQKEAYLPTVVAEPNAEIAETIKRVSDGNKKVLKILDQTNAVSITNAALQSESQLSPAAPKVTIQDSQEIFLEHQDNADLVQDSVAVQDDKLPQVGFVETSEIPVSAPLESNLAHDSINENQVSKSVEYKVVSSLGATIGKEQKPVTTSEFDEPISLAKDAQVALTHENHDEQTSVEALVKTQADNEEFKIADQAKEEIVLQQIEQQPLTSKAVAQDLQEPILASDALSQVDDIASQLPKEESKVIDQTQEEPSLAQPVDEDLSAALIVDEKPTEISAEPLTDISSEPEKVKKSLDEPTAEISSESQLQDQSIAVEAVAIPQPDVDQPEKTPSQEVLSEQLVSKVQEEPSLIKPAEQELAETPVVEKPAEASDTEPLVDNVPEEPSTSEPEKVGEVKVEQVQEEAPAVEYWEQFVGNENYGKYDADGNWEWSGYFDDNNNWVASEAAQESFESAAESQLQDQSIAVETVTPQPDVEQPEQTQPQEESPEQLVSKAEEVQEEASLLQPAEQELTATSSDEKPSEASDTEPLVDTAPEEPSTYEPEKVGEVKVEQVPEEASTEAPAAEYWEQFVGNENYGKYDADGNWEWSGYFDDNNNWVASEAAQESFEPAFHESQLQDQSIAAETVTSQPDFEQPEPTQPQEALPEQLVSKAEEVQEEPSLIQPAEQELAATPADEKPAEVSDVEPLVDTAPEEPSTSEPEKVEEAKVEQVQEEAPAAEYWEQFVGNENYGKYDADGNWEWSGYFDDNNNWVASETAQESFEPAAESQLQDQSIAAETVTPQPDVEQPEQTQPQEESPEQLVSKAEEVQEEPSLIQPAEQELAATPADEKPAEASDTEPLVETVPEEPSTSEPEKVEEAKSEKVPEEASAAEYWEQFVGNKDYGKYDKDGNWEWSGYFDDDNNWIPNDEDENTEIVDAVEGTNFISADDEGKIDFDKYVGNENFGYYDENNEWEWYEGDFDEDGNWMVYEQGEPDKNYDITEDIPVFKNIDTDSVDADEWLSQFNEDDADTIFGGK